MQSRETLKRHAILVDRMAGHVGIDLQEAALSGKVTISEIDDAVMRCTGCSQPCACEKMLDSQRIAASAPPSFCRNIPLFDGLKS